MTETARRFELPGFSGTLIHPGDDGYDDTRSVFNGMIDRRPALIARCSTADDVVAAVNVGRDDDLPLTVYSGGHGVTGAAVADGAVCVDLRGMKGIAIDADARTARAEAGLTWGEFDAATQAHGLAVTGGRVSTTGVAGLALGSGSGWLERKHGFTCDNLISAEVVTADGRKVIASADENADLFFGLRGGGGNFGIVTAFNLRLHAVGPIVLGGLLMFPIDAAPDVVRFYRDFVAQAPDELGTAMAFITAPPEEFVPEPVRGQPVIGVVICWAGDIAEGEAAVRPLREHPAVGMDMVSEMPYVAVQQLLDGANPKGLQNYWTADFYDSLPDDAIDAFVEHASKPISPWTQNILIPGGGALARISDDATALGFRTAAFNIHYLSMWEDAAEADQHIAFTKTLAGAMKPWSTGGAYLNFLGDEGLARVEASFGPGKFTRLRELKRTWDPTNLFRHNQNIPPA